MGEKHTRSPVRSSGLLGLALHEDMSLVSRCSLLRVCTAGGSPAFK